MTFVFHNHPICKPLRTYYEGQFATQITWKLSWNLTQQYNADVKGKKHNLQSRKHGLLPQEFLQLGLWYMASSISYILRKAKVFNNQCCRDAFKDSRMGNQAMLVDPYFSIPVIPHTIIASNIVLFCSKAMMRAHLPKYNAVS